MTRGTKTEARGGVVAIWNDVFAVLLTGYGKARALPLLALYAFDHQ